MTPLILLSCVLIAFYVGRKYLKKDSWQSTEAEFPDDWRIILSSKVVFYNALSKEEKVHFEFKVQEFLLNCRITGIETTIDQTDRLLVASSAIIPIFEFKNWRYFNLDEVLIYPASFNMDFESSGEGRSILGMVGTGYMEGKMILSKRALQQGFSNERDKKNTAIHEFVHLIDKMDGTVDGFPALLLEKQYAIPWMDLIDQKINEIYESRSDINPYGGTNRQEFFAVTSEYFFERPKLLEKKHPKLYGLLEEIFNQEMNEKDLTRINRNIGRNDPCPCGSGIKFKKCCGK